MDEASRERCLKVMVWQNTWWGDGLDRWRAGLPEYRRRLAVVLPGWLLAPKWRRHVLVVGPRRVGKTTVLEQAVGQVLEGGYDPRRVLWLRLDHPELAVHPLGDLVELGLERARAMGVDATPDAPVLLMLDEVTRAKDWDLWLKTFHDDRWPVRVVATSSATSMLRDFRRESGAGRWVELSLPPLLLHEIIARTGAPSDLAMETGFSLPWGEGALATPRMEALHALDVRLQFAGFPGVLLTGDDDSEAALVRWQGQVREDVLNNAIYKDLLLSVGLREPEKLERLVQLLAGQLCGIASAQSLGQTLGVSQPTVDRYLQHLESTHLLFCAPCWGGTEEVKARRGRKVYFADGLVRNAALQNGWAALMDDSERGKLRENAVAAHLRAVASRRGLRLYHWRERDSEVDFVLDHPERPLAVEVASSSGHTRKGLRALAAKHPEVAGRSWLTWPGAPLVRPAEAEDGIGTVDLSVLLQTLGRDADDAIVGP